jgi:predicted GTPase
MRQFYSTSIEQARKTQEKANIVSQVLKKMSLMEQDDLVDAFFEHVSEKSYLIVLNDMSTIEEWHAIKEYFPDNKKGSRIIVSTEHGEVASLCTGQENIVSELNQPSVDQNIFASHNKVISIALEAV